MLFSRAGKGELVLILDLQSTLICGALSLMRPGAAPAVVWAGSIPIAFTSGGIQNADYVPVALKTISTVVDSALRFLHSGAVPAGIPHRIGEIHIVMSSPWVVSQGKSISQDFSKEAVITHAKIQHMMDEERTALASHAKGEVRVIEEKIFDIKLNGYSVATWENRPARQLQVSYGVSIAGMRTLDLLVHACRQAVHAKHVHFHSSLLLEYFACRTIFPNVSDYAIVHVHGELTDVALVESQSGIFFGSMPVGIMTIARFIAERGHMSTAGAESLMSLYTNDSLDDSHGQKGTAVVTDAVHTWISGLDGICSGHNPPTVMPRTIMLSGGAHDAFFKAELEIAYTSAIVHTTTPADLSPHVSCTDLPGHEFLVGLYALAINQYRDSAGGQINTL